MHRKYRDAEAAVLLMHVVSMAKEQWEKHDEVAVVAAVCDWERARAAAAVEKAKTQLGRPPEGHTPQDADIAEKLLVAVVVQPPGICFERLLAFVRRWPVERARRAFAAAARAGLLEWVSSS